MHLRDIVRRVCPISLVEQKPFLATRFGIVKSHCYSYPLPTKHLLEEISHLLLLLVSLRTVINFIFAVHIPQMT